MHPSTLAQPLALSGPGARRRHPHNKHPGLPPPATVLASVGRESGEWKKNSPPDLRLHRPLAAVQLICGGRQGAVPVVAPRRQVLAGAPAGALTSPISLVARGGRDRCDADPMELRGQRSQTPGLPTCGPRPAYTGSRWFPTCV
ncbi:unnamed protein product [Boreogadus saida]